MTPTPQRRALALAILVLLVAPAILLAPSLLGERVFMPFDPAGFAPAATKLTDAELALVHEQRANTDVTEVPFLVVPEMELAQQEIAAGRFPGWNPYARFGGPLYANGLAALAYPPNWLLLARDDPVDGLALNAYLSYVIAGVLMLAFLRACGVGMAAATLGALVFAVGGTLTANAHFYMRENALIWLPGMLLASLRLGERQGRDRIPAALGLAACTAMTWLAGFPPFAITSTLFAGVFGLGVLVRSLRADGARAAVRLALWIGAGFALGFALCAVQLAPTLAYFPESSRNLTPPPNSIARLGYDPMALLGLVLPEVFGEPSSPTPAYANSAVALLLHTRSHWVASAEGPAGRLFFPSNYNFTEYTLFVGALPLALAAIGVVLGRGRPRLSMPALAVAWFVLATGPAWLAWVFDLPGMPKNPMRFSGPLCVAIAALAALGLDAVVRRRGGRALVVAAVACGAVSIACAVLAGLAPSWDLVGAIADRYAHLLPAEAPRERVVSFLGQAQLDASRERLVASLWSGAARFAAAAACLAAWSFAGRRGGRAFGVMTVATIALAGAELLEFGARTNTHRTRPFPVRTEVQDFLRDAWEPGGVTIARADTHTKVAVDLPSGLLFPERIRDLNAYAFLDPWSYEPFVALYGKGQMTREVWPMAFPDDQRLELPFFDLLGVRYVLATTELEHGGAEVLRVDGPRGAFLVHERPSPMPRAFVVGALRELPDRAAVVTAMLARDLDPRAAVLVEPGAHAALAAHPADPAAGRPVRWIRDDPDAVVLEVDDGPAGYLVLADAALRGWTATVDGEPVEIARGNLFMRVVPIAAGAHRIAFRYRPPGLAAGGVLTVLALLVVAAALVLRFRSRRARPDAEVSV